MNRTFSWGAAWNDKDIEHDWRFLVLWKDADPGIVAEKDARQRLAGLKGQ